MLCSKENEGKLSDGVYKAGTRCGEEVLRFLDEVGTRSIRTLSVIGHSLGGIVGRCMLGWLKMHGMGYC